MAYFKINKQKIQYDEGLEYLVVGVVGSSHGGDIYDVFPLNIARQFTDLSQDSRHSDFKYEIKANLGYMIKFLETGIFDSANGMKKLSPEEKPALERGINLYTRVLSAVEKQ